ncbi:MAG: hypothetical protein QNJ98_02620 [Planctomycetota bacterium]|nr:hypothetical protein [Planctomycetota bacterium]
MPLAGKRRAAEASALLVMPPGAARKQAVAALRPAGFSCRSAREPYEGTARFVEQPADLVLLSLERFRVRDIGFVTTVRRRSPGTRILLLVPEGSRALAVRCLEAGADAYVLSPFFAAELASVAQRLVHGARKPQAAPADGSSLARLATEVSHAVNNPLQVLSLLGEAERNKERKKALEAEVGRVRDVVDILSRYGHRAAPQKDRGLLGPLLTKCLEGYASEKQLLLDGRPPADGPAFAFDAEQVSKAFEDLVGLVVARGTEQPMRVAARVRTQSAPSGGMVEAAVRGRGLELPGEEIDGLRASVVWSHDETRKAHPGLALAEAVARDHGGRVTRRGTRYGTVLALELPVA